jgi:hypothetical protein
MPESGQDSPYDVFAVLRERLLHRPADTSAVSLLGQAVSDVLDSRWPHDDVKKVIADLEAARSEANDGKLNHKWYLPLTSLLGLLNQHIHNEEVGLAAFDGTSMTLRDKVLAAIDAGFVTPKTIGPQARSFKTNVLQVLTDLLHNDDVELDEHNVDPYECSYCRVRKPPPSYGPVAAEIPEYRRAGRPETYDWRG